MKLGGHSKDGGLSERTGKPTTIMNSQRLVLRRLVSALTLSLTLCLILTITLGFTCTARTVPLARIILRALTRAPARTHAGSHAGTFSATLSVLPLTQNEQPLHLRTSPPFLVKYACYCCTFLSYYTCLSMHALTFTGARPSPSRSRNKVSTYSALMQRLRLHITFRLLPRMEDFSTLEGRERRALSAGRPVTLKG